MINSYNYEQTKSYYRVESIAGKYYRRAWKISTSPKFGRFGDGSKRGYGPIPNALDRMAWHQEKTV